MFNLSRKKALVTGSSRGIGRAIAVGLAAQGATVALHAREASDELYAAVEAVERNGGGTMMVTGNLSDPGIAPTIVDLAAERLGGLDVLVNNAGHVVPQAADEMDLETWRSVLDVNLTSAFFCSQSAARHMRKEGLGRIVSISSQAAEVAIPAYVHYGVSKAGLNIMTRYLATEWATAGITVNAVAPAFVQTEQATEVFAQLPDLYEDQLERVPKGRMCTLDEVTAAVVYLVSDEADFTTGEILHVDGGYLAL